MCKECDSTLRAQVKQLVALLFPSFLPPSFLPSAWILLELQVNTPLRYNVPTMKWTDLHEQFDGGVTFTWVKRRTPLSSQRDPWFHFQSLTTFELCINIWLI